MAIFKSFLYVYQRVYTNVNTTTAAEQTPSHHKIFDRVFNISHPVKRIQKRKSSLIYAFS